ncbi:hypothetical protein B0H63DRAFT_453971 [Podospora didyma]|uniref:Uncharacterized protein n=1 Tax=Podospora didyma TaxID=330526 RepID=A0AAE0KA41_9PEZI|nr:hypothetical protein B0H63DRAFT_453971 [Podospora didyma]
MLVHPASDLEYFIGLFGSILLASVLSILLQLLTSSLNKMLPFFMLVKYGGTKNGLPMGDSLCLVSGGIAGPFVNLRLLHRYREPIPILGDLLTLLSIVLTSTSSSAIALGLFGGCGRELGCFMTLGVYTAVLRLGEALLLFMALVVIILEDPWSMKYIDFLLPPTSGNHGTGSELKLLLRELGPPSMSQGRVSTSAIAKKLHGIAASLGYYSHPDDDRVDCYGIITRRTELHPAPETENVFELNILRPTITAPPPPGVSVLELARTSTNHNTSTTRFSLPLDLAYDIIFLILLFVLFCLIVAYEINGVSDSFEEFMDSQGFGGISLLKLYRALSHHFYHPSPSPTGFPPAASVPPPATTVFSGLYYAIVQQDALCFVVAVAGVLSKFMPIIMANIPFHSLQTWEVHIWTAWMTVGVLAYMLVVLLGCFFIRWPTLPVVPESIAGWVYYIACAQPVPEDRGFVIDVNGLNEMIADCNDTY